MNDTPQNVQLVEHLTGEIIAAAAGAHMEQDQCLRGVLAKLLSLQPEPVWVVVGTGLLTKDQGFGVNVLVGAHYLVGKEVAVISTVPDSVLLNWCEKHGERAVHAVAQCIPLFVESSDGPEWSPLARQILQRYGADRQVLDTLSANLHCYGYHGTEVSPLRARLRLVESLQLHAVAEVRQWAGRLSDSFRQQLREAESKDEERQLTQ